MPVTAITEAVFARALSSRRDQRVAAKSLPGPARACGAQPAQSEIDARSRRALRLQDVAYAQGFDSSAAASAQYGWNLNLGEIATIWRGGCIIRARFLDRITEAYDSASQARKPAARRRTFATRSLQGRAGVAARRRPRGRTRRAAPALSPPRSPITTACGARAGPANLLQGLRDYFGAHTYRRLDKPGSFHTRWGEGGMRSAFERCRRSPSGAPWTD